MCHPREKRSCLSVCCRQQSQAKDKAVDTEEQKEMIDPRGVSFQRETALGSNHYLQFGNGYKQASQGSSCVVHYPFLFRRILKLPFQDTHARTLLTSTHLLYYGYLLHSFIFSSSSTMQRASFPASLTLRDPISTDHSFVNYSIPLHDSSPSSLPTLEQPRRPVPAGSADARLRELENEIEKLTLSNIRLLRTNRILKLDCDRIVDEQTSELREEIAHLRHQNVRLQRNNRLLQDDLKQRMQEMNQMRDDQIRKMKNVGPEYEYLVQMINLLYRQLQGKSTCDETCCFTNKPLDQGFSVLTLPPESEEQRPEPQHICRPSVQSHISGGSLACAAQQEIAMLRQELEEMRNDKENLYDMLHEKEDDLETLKCELKMKDNIVTQLEKDFERMELEVVDLQKDWRHPGDRIKSHTSFSDIHAFPIPPPLPKD